MNIDDGAGHLVSTLTDTLIQSVQDPSLLAEITEGEILALIAEVTAAREVRGFNSEQSF